jgi:hypothetical protein
MRRLHGLLLSGLLLVGPVWAKHWHEDQDRWKWHAQHPQDEGDGDDRHDKGCYFKVHDVRVISEYYPPRYRPRLRSRLEKMYHRNGPLPPGRESRLELFPVEVERQLTRIPTEYRRGIIDGFTVVYNPQSGMIIDVTELFGGRYGVLQ